MRRSISQIRQPLAKVLLVCSLLVFYLHALLMNAVWADEANQAPKGPDQGWQQIYQNKSWAYQLEGKLGGILVVALGAKPLCLQVDCPSDPVSAWVRWQMQDRAGEAPAFELEEHRPGEWAILKATSNPLGQAAGQAGKPNLFGVEFHHTPNPKIRLNELREGLAHVVVLTPNELKNLAPFPAGHRMAALNPHDPMSPRLVLSHTVHCDCQSHPCSLDLSCVWFDKK